MTPAARDRQTAPPTRAAGSRRPAETARTCLCGLAAFSVYLLTLCPAVYPGRSALSVASVLNLLPQAAAEHPAWNCLARTVAKLPLSTLPFRLNLFSALCGALAVAALYRLTRRLLAELLRHAPQAETGPDGTASFAGLMAAFAFAFGAPFWSASVSLNPQTFDLLLFFLMADFLASAVFTGNLLCGLSAVFICGLGVTESALFVAAAPAVLYLFCHARRKHGLNANPLARHAFLVAGVPGIACGLAPLVSPAAANDAFGLAWLGGLFRDIAHAHVAEMTSALQQAGWLPLALGTLLPLLAVVWSAALFLTSRERLSQGSVILQKALITITAALCLLGLAHGPWAWSRTDALPPVIAGLATALTIGLLAAYWRLLRTAPPLADDEAEDEVPPPRAQQALALGMASLIVALVCLAPLRNFGDADGRKGAFADPVARQLLALTGEADRLVTDGVLDTHVLIQAHLAGRRLALVPASAAGDLGQPGDGAQLAVAAAPSLLTRSGLCAVPNGLTYRGAADTRAIDGQALLRQHETLWNALAPLLAPELKRPPALASLLSAVRQQASRVANDLGALLEDRGCDKEASVAYGQALALDQDNLCASFNLYGLELRNAAGVSPQSHEDLLQRVAARYDRGFLFERCAARYGALHSQPADLLARHNATAQHPLVLQWIAYCQSRATAETALPPPAEGAISIRENALELATHALRAGDTAEAESRLRAFLSANPNDLAGWALFADLLQSSGRTAELASLVLPSIRKAAGEKGHELVDRTEGLLALGQTPPRYREARIFFLRALERRPGLKECQEQLLQTDRLIGDPALTESDAANILRTDPSHCTAHTLLGGIRREQQRCEEAEAHFRRSVAARPASDTLDSLANLLRVKKSLPEAEKAARHALRIDPDYYPAWDTLSNVLAEQNRLGEAETAIRNALSLCGNDPRLLLTLTRLHLRTNRTREE
jgi:tetratricopeptide (TPR) repeat protein